MATTCTPTALLELGKCFTGLSLQQLEAIQAYLLAVAAGGTTDVDDLMASSACFQGLSKPQLDAIRTYLLCQIANATPPVGETDGLIWGPSPETVDDVNGAADNVFTAIDTFITPTGAYTTLSFGNPTTVTNNVDFNTSLILTSLTMRLLETVGNDILLNGSTALASLSFPALLTVGNDINLQNVTPITNPSFPSLTTVANQILIDGSTIETLSLPSLSSYPATGITADATLLTLNLPACVDDGAGQLNTDIQNMTGLETLNLAALTSFTADFELGNTVLTSLTVTSLVSIGGSFIPSGCSLSSISLPSLTTITANLTADNILPLTSFSAPLWVPTDGTLINFQNCALDATSVELILRRCVLAGVVACTIDLSGGTNAGTASLSAQGQADVATLGAQVTMNP